MTPKEKAKDLVDKMENYQSLVFVSHSPNLAKEYTKQCALIAVDEILNGSRLFYFEDYKYWNEVKQEIEKL